MENNAETEQEQAWKRGIITTRSFALLLQLNDNQGRGGKKGQRGVTGKSIWDEEKKSFRVSKGDIRSGVQIYA